MCSVCIRTISPLSGLSYGDFFWSFNEKYHSYTSSINTRGNSPPFLDALFTPTSAACGRLRHKKEES